MEVLEFSFLALAVVLTSTLSAIIGMGGGILLLAIMLLVEPNLLLVVPLHGAVQLTSNVTRVGVFRHHLLSWIMNFYFIGALVGMVMAWVILAWIQGLDLDRVDPWLKILVAVYIFCMLFHSRGTKEGPKLSRVGFGFLGLSIIPISTIVGATGPLLAPFFIRYDLKKDEVIANKAFCQVMTHFFKLVAFAGATTFSFGRYGYSLIGFILAAILGTFLGKWITSYVSEPLFRKLYKIALFLAASKILVIDGILNMV